MLTQLRRQSTVLVSLVILLALLTGCVGIVPPTESGAPAAAPTSVSAASAVSTTMRLFTDDAGRTVEIPVAPQRVIVTDFAAELIAVGVTPIAAGENDFKNVFTQAAMAGVERIGDPPNVEKIVSLDPDLIILSTIYPQIYPELLPLLEAIAPVILFSFDQDPIYDTFPKIADAVGKAEQVQAWIVEYEQERDAARTQVQAALGDENVSIFRVEADRLRVYLNRNFGGYMLYTALQVTPPLAVADEIAKTPFGSATQISLEALPDYAADHIFVIVRNEGDDQVEFQRIQALDLWKNLPAV